MIGLCALVWASVCIPQEYFPVTKYVAMFSNAEMNAHNNDAAAAQARTGTAVSIEYSDFMGTALAAKLDRVCDDAFCVYYRRHCDSPLHCRFVLGRAPLRSTALTVTMGDTLDISVRAPQDMRAVMESFTFVQAATWSTNAQAGTITVTMLDKESPDIDIRQLEPPLPTIRR